MAPSVVTSRLPKQQAKKLVLDLLDIVITYAEELSQLKPSYNMLNTIREMKSVEDDVKNNIPLKFSIVVDAKFLLLTNQIINFRSSISWNLKQFWEAQIDMMEISATSKKHYEPTKQAMANKDKILEVNARYEKTAKRYAKNQNDEVLLYALFYNHILKTETIEHSLLKQFKETLVYFALSKNYDAERIFSVTDKIQKGWKKKKGKKIKVWRTDARAIRDCLGHNLYKLNFQKDPWKVHFKSTRKGFEYDKIFTKNSFTKFMNDTDLLYRSSLMLLFHIVALTIIKQHLL